MKIYKLKEHFQHNKYFYLNTTLISAAFMLNTDIAFAGIDDGGQRIYNKLTNVGKWVIIIKGGYECIQGVLNGDSQSAKKQFLNYLLVYGILLALPWSMDEIETIFK